MPESGDVFARLRTFMEPSAPPLTRAADRDDELSLDSAHVQPNGSPLWFGGVQIRKRYLSYHLMPVYVNPAPLNGMSPVPKGRMQGTSCFNFTKVDEAVFEELAALTRAGYDDYRAKGYVERRYDARRRGWGRVIRTHVLGAVDIRGTFASTFG